MRRRPGGSGRRGHATSGFGVGNVYHLAFDDRAFDLIHAHQVLRTCSTRSLRRTAALCAGGLIAARDGD